MREEEIRTLLKEFDYDKNTLKDTLGFLLYISNYIYDNIYSQKED